MPLAPTPLIALLAISSTGIHLEEVGELPLADAMSAVESLSRAIERRLGHRVAVDDPSWTSTCESPNRCLEEIRLRMRADDVVFVRAFGGPSLIHLVIERVPPTPAASRTAEADLSRTPRTRDEWTSALEATAKILFPEAVSPPPKAPELAAAPAPAASSAERSTLSTALPWIAVGTGVAAAIAGGVFGASSADAKAELERGVHLEREYGELSDRVQTHGLAANVLFGAAIAGVATGAVLFIVE